VVLQLDGNVVTVLQALLAYASVKLEVLVLKANAPTTAIAKAAIIEIRVIFIKQYLVIYAYSFFRFSASPVFTAIKFVCLIEHWLIDYFVQNLFFSG
jgi:hypothetical protein